MADEGRENNEEKYQNLPLPIFSQLFFQFIQGKRLKYRLADERKLNDGEKCKISYSSYFIIPFLFMYTWKKTEIYTCG